MGNKRSKSTIHVSFLSNRISNYFLVFWSLGSKPKKQPKRERTEEEKTFRRRARYFLGTQVVAVLVFLSVMSSNDFSEVEVDEDEDEDEGFSYDWRSIHFLTNLYFPWQLFSSWQYSHGHHCERDSFLFTFRSSILLVTCPARCRGSIIFCI